MGTLGIVLLVSFALLIVTTVVLVIAGFLFGRYRAKNNYSQI